MTTFKRVDHSQVTTLSVRKRKSKVTPRDFAKPFDADRDSFSDFVASLPSVLKVNDLRALVSDILRSRRRNRPVVLMLGAHVIKVGLAPILIDLLKREIITMVAMNSAAAIHDVETALWGKTSEDVSANLQDGTFGMARETGEFVNGTLGKAFGESDRGYGEALGLELLKCRAPHREVSLLAACSSLGVPATVRASMALAHTEADVEALLRGLHRVREVFG